MELYYQPKIVEGVLELTEDESRHCIKVLRHQVGDKITVIDGLGSFYDVELTRADAKHCTYQILSKRHSEPRKFSVAIAIAPTKSIDRTEWFIEKAVEIGVDSIVVYFGHHSERKNIKLDRIMKKAVAAMKQSGQALLPTISISKNLKSCVTQFEKFEERFIAYVDENNPLHLMTAAQPNKSTVILIGPEGDFSSAELGFALENGYKKVSLGTNRLRTETAGIAACHILNLINR